MSSNYVQYGAALSGKILAVCLSPAHRFSKTETNEIQLIESWGIDGDAHAGNTVKHRSRVRANPLAPNLRQVHLIASEVIDSLKDQGFPVSPGAMGENLTTIGVNLLELPTHSRLMFQSGAILELTGLRDPCFQLDQNLGTGLRAALRPEVDGVAQLRLGVMAIVQYSGSVARGDTFEVVIPDGNHKPLVKV